MPNKYSILLFAGILGMTLFCSCKRDVSCEGGKCRNQPAVAHAGTDKQVRLPEDSIQLEGSLSYDPDGVISEWRWTMIAGPSTFTFPQQTTVKAGLVNPVSRVMLDAGASTDPDNNIAAHNWTLISGSPGVTIVDPAAVQTRVENRAAGTCQFELKVTDSLGLFSRDTVGVLVKDPSSKISWSPDGTRIVYTSASVNGNDISWVAADGADWRS